MKKERVKIFLACAFGAGIGSFIALEVAQYFWWAGALAGGLIGYVGYDWRGAIVGFQYALRDAVSKRAVARIFLHTLSACNVALWCALIYISARHMPIPIGVGRDMTNLEEPITIVSSVAVVFAAVGSLVFLVVPIASKIPALHYNFESKEDNFQQGLLVFVVGFFPPVTFLMLAACLLCMGALAAYLLYMGAQAVAPQIQGCGSFIQWLRAFTKSLIIHIHSDERLLCGCDAMIGSIVGYRYGSVIVGTLVGGVLGILHYEIVSKRLLRLVPR